ncbi:hypothetical protein CSB45_05930 [candidate division KSB3 bacterium]|uniref:DUF4194 domain-containing protein n=1 Tax=candidate division KSB3 bacterium TaxID=2044937 RepID=A0A2G6E6P3_9BACT|nr:MAG: hypothetical protein CSB45_05930 [candidate division KSB3 bacterium]PIE30189.1 MAG: hypothetical protein CSA57_04650 [candidate division KSB3 bacterium]
MENAVVEYAHVVIKLLQDVLYDEDTAVWSDLLTYQISVRDYLAKIGLELHLDEREGFAFLQQSNDEAHKLPRLVRRIPLSYELTLLCVLLREILEEFDVKDVESRKCFVSADELREKSEIFFRDSPNTVRLLERFDKTVQAAVRLGFLKETDQENSDTLPVRYELRRIIKAKISNEKLEEIRQKLANYVEP